MPGAPRVRPADPDDASSRTVRGLFARALFRPDDGKVDRFLERARSTGAEVLLAERDGAVVGELTIQRNIPGAGGSGTILSIAVDAGHERTGIGRALVTAFLDRHPGVTLEAETDAATVGFYHGLGFQVVPLGETYPGTARYRCVFDDSHFDPLPYAEAWHRFAALGVRAWVAGGWALDLFLGRQTRPHEDTDLLICRSDREAIFRAFRGWELYRTHAPGLAPCREPDIPAATPNVWLRSGRDRPWSVEVMFVDVAQGEWVYRRNAAIRGHLDGLGLRSAEGIAYLRPEIQLLYKGGSSRRRGKDDRDFQAVLPHLDAGARRWLQQALGTQFPGGHPWFTALEEPPIA